MGQVAAYRNAAQSLANATGVARQTATNTTSVNVTGITTAADNQLIVVACCGGQEAAWSAIDATSPTVASSTASVLADPSDTTWQERADNLTTSGADTSLAIVDAIKTTAGATGNITATASVGANHLILIGTFEELQHRRTGGLCGGCGLVPGPVRVDGAFLCRLGLYPYWSIDRQAPGFIGGNARFLVGAEHWRGGARFRELLHNLRHARHKRPQRCARADPDRDHLQ